MRGYTVGVDIGSHGSLCAIVIARRDGNGVVHVLGNGTASSARTAMKIATMQAIENTQWWKRWWVAWKLQKEVERMYQQVQP